MTLPRLVVAAVAALAVSLAAGACAAQAPLQQAQGIVLEVEGTLATGIEGFTLRTDGGEVLEFTIGELDLTRGAFDAGHLRAHQLGVEPVRVFYRDEGGSRVALRLEDA